MTPALPIAENPAVIAPAKTLTTAQRDALTAINFFRSQVLLHDGWRFGNKRASFKTVAALQRHGLVSKSGSLLTVTEAGKLAIQRLEKRP